MNNSNEGGALIHLRVPASLKARWVRESRAAGMRLTDWIIHRMETPVQPRITTSTAVIPDDVKFADLELARDPDGHISFDWSPIERICAASGRDVAVFRDGPEDNLASLLSAWYHAHRSAGGERDAVYEDLIAEVQAEDAAGQHYSHAPGRA